MRKSTVLEAIKKEMETSKLFSLAMIERALNTIEKQEWTPEEIDGKLMNDDLLRYLLSICCQITGVTYKEAVGSCRKRETVYTRFIFCMYVREHYKTIFSFKKIGSILGGRDHTTIIAAIKKGKIYLVGHPDPYFVECYNKLCQIRTGNDIFDKIDLDRIDPVFKALIEKHFYPKKALVKKPKKMMYEDVPVIPIKRQPGIYSNSPSPLKIYKS